MSIKISQVPDTDLAPLRLNVHLLPSCDVPHRKEGHFIMGPRGLGQGLLIIILTVYSVS